MKNTVLQYESTLNGIQAWKDLYTVMEQTELDNVIEFQGLASLVTLKKNHGFESFLNDYHAAMKKVDPDGTMKESKKKFYLLYAIKKETRYAYTADACDSESLLKTITKLRIKAQELKDLVLDDELQMPQSIQNAGYLPHLQLHRYPLDSAHFLLYI